MPAAHALLSIEKRALGWATCALPQLQVVNLPSGAGEALLLAEIEIVRDEARDAGIVVPEIVILAFTDLCGWIEALAQGAVFAAFCFAVVEGSCRAGSAFAAVEKWPLLRAIHAFGSGGVIDLFVGAEDALSKTEIEEFRDHAFDTVSLIPKSLLFWALTVACSKYFSSLAGLAVPSCWIPHSLVRAGRTLGTIEVRICLRTSLADLTGDAVDLVFTAVFALVFVEVVIVGVVAWSAKSAIEE